MGGMPRGQRDTAIQTHTHEHVDTVAERRAPPLREHTSGGVYL